MIENLFESWGYLASFLGTLIEGEILLLTSIISAKLGYFNLYGGMVAAFLGAFVRDSLQFLIAKKQGKKLLAKKPKLQAKLHKASGWFDKNPYLYLTIYRLMYGFSMAIVMVSALKDHISYARFTLHSTIAISIWLGIYGGFGYFFAQAMIERLTFLNEYSLEIIGTLSIIGVAYWFFIKRFQDTHHFTP